MQKYRSLLIGLGIIVFFGIFYASCQNNLVSSRNAVDEAWANVQTQYQRRADLIPNLVNTVKGYAAQEERVLTEVTEMRSRVGGINMSSEILDDPEAFAKFQKAQSELGGALQRLLVVSENYPVLQSNQNFLALQSQIEGTENRIGVARTRYNKAVKEYNTSVESFPSSIIAGIGGFRTKPMFTADAGADKAPSVNF